MSECTKQELTNIQYVKLNMFYVFNMEKTIDNSCILFDTPPHCTGGAANTFMSLDEGNKVIFWVAGDILSFFCNYDCKDEFKLSEHYEIPVLQHMKGNILDQDHSFECYEIGQSVSTKIFPELTEYINQICTIIGSSNDAETHDEL